MNKTLRTARYIWIGIGLSLALFFAQIWKMLGGELAWNPNPTVDSIFVFISAIVFAYAFFFLNGYLKLRKAEILRGTNTDKYSVLLLAYVIQFLLFETVGIFGLLLSIFSHSAVKSIPFVIASYVGLIIFFPKQDHIKNFYRGDRSEP